MFIKFFENDTNSPSAELNDSIASDERTESIDSSVLSSVSSFDGSCDNSSIINESTITTELPENETKQPGSGNDIVYNNIEESIDYFYSAALSFSKAVQEEANLRYQTAFQLYKVGIDELLTGAKNDHNEKRRAIAKTKAAKYLERAELLYENHITKQNEDALSCTITASEAILELERPYNCLSKYKVIGVNDNIMTVQDCTDKKIYAMKAIWRSNDNRSIYLPQHVPYMVSLVHFFQTDDTIFLLMPLISGGLLWNYIANYSNKKTPVQSNLEDLFVELPIEKKRQEEFVTDTIEQKHSDEEELPIKPKLNFAHSISLEEISTAAPPSFDTLSADIDLENLMTISQKLLNSVSKTLQKSQIQAKTKEPIKEQNLISNSETSDQKKQLQIFEKTNEKSINSINIIQSVSSDVPDTILKQWSCELITAIYNLHKTGVTVCDLNLDNLLLGRDGHIILTHILQSDPNEHQQLCRLNPRAIKCLYVAFDFPLSFVSDWYSVGVIIYELLTKSRFYQYHTGGIARYNEIQYPELSVELSEDARDLLHGLIMLPSESRLKYDDIIKHPFFKDVDWAYVERIGMEINGII